MSRMPSVCLSPSYRTIFVRESWTPVMLQSPDASVPPFPARLLWLYRSSSPRHLSLCVRSPSPSPNSFSAGSSFESLEGSDSSSAPDSQRRAEDFVYGRLFLRPYDVAQLLTVLQGWSDAPALVERPRSSLQLRALAPPPSAKKGQPSSSASFSSLFLGAKPRAVQLTARLTRKLLSQEGKGDYAKASTPITDLDPEASEDYPKSVYAEGEMGTLTTVLRNEDLVLLTAHLESVLSDFFSLEHHAVREVTRRALGRHERSGNTKYISYSEQSGDHTHLRSLHTGAHESHPQYRSHMYQSRQPIAAAAGTGVHRAVVMHPIELDGLFGAVEDAAENLITQMESKAPTPEPASPPSPSAAVKADAAGDDADEYEEVAEEVEEVEEVEPQRVKTAADSNESEMSGAGGEHSDGADTPSATSAVEVDDSLDAEPDSTTTTTIVAGASTAAPTISYQASHTEDSGYATKLGSRNASGRFVRDGSVVAAEAQKVSRIGDFDVLHSTQCAQGSTEQDGARTTVQATSTTGAFCSTSGEVSGTFAYQRLSTVTGSSSDATAAADAAATAIPVRRTESSAPPPRQATAGKGVERKGDTLSSTMEMRATAVTEVGAGKAEEDGEEQEEEPSTDKEAGHKHASHSRGSAKKKSRKKKSKMKKAPKRKLTSKVSMAASPAQTMSF
jgi:hypothetical protein